MLNKDICKKCRQEHCRCKWDDELDNEMWEVDLRVRCTMYVEDFEAFGAGLPVDERLPRLPYDCPYILEQSMYHRDEKYSKKFIKFNEHGKIRTVNEDDIKTIGDAKKLPHKNIEDAWETSLKTIKEAVLRSLL